MRQSVTFCAASRRRTRGPRRSRPHTAGGHPGGEPARPPATAFLAAHGGPTRRATPSTRPSPRARRSRATTTADDGANRGEAAQGQRQRVEASVQGSVQAAGGTGTGRRDWLFGFLKGATLDGGRGGRTSRRSSPLRRRAECRPKIENRSAGWRRVGVAVGLRLRSAVARRGALLLPTAVPSPLPDAFSLPVAGQRGEGSRAGSRRRSRGASRGARCAPSLPCLCNVEHCIAPSCNVNIASSGCSVMALRPPLARNPLSGEGCEAGEGESAETVDKYFGHLQAVLRPYSPFPVPYFPGSPGRCRTVLVHVQRCQYPLVADQGTPCYSRSTFTWRFFAPTHPPTAGCAFPPVGASIMEPRCVGVTPEGALYSPFRRCARIPGNPGVGLHSSASPFPLLSYGHSVFAYLCWRSPPLVSVWLSAPPFCVVYLLPAAE